MMDYYDIPGVNIALIQKGELVWSKAYGYADLSSGRKMTVDTYCRVESISKAVTSWGIMKLVGQGKIDLDTPVWQYIKSWQFPESNFSEEKITARQLLSHSSSLPLGDVFERYGPKEEIPSLYESLSQEAILIREPGLLFSYSNTGFNLLELLVEEVTGSAFADFMQKEVLNPLGMNKSSFVWSEDLKPAIPIGYDLKNNPIPVYVYPAKASGGLLACVEDIAVFVAAGMVDFRDEKQEVLNNHSISQLYKRSVDIPGFYGLVFDYYGLGHFIEILSNGEQAVSHGGQGGGCMTHFNFRQAQVFTAQTRAIPHTVSTVLYFYSFSVRSFMSKQSGLLIYFRSFSGGFRLVGAFNTCICRGFIIISLVS